jgi:predicted DNA-binding transcriptional regulator AlpA
MDRLLDFNDLKSRGVLRNRTTLSRWINELGFPPGTKIGPNSRRWRESEIEAWLADRAAITQAQEAR